MVQALDPTFSQASTDLAQESPLPNDGSLVKEPDIFKISTPSVQIEAYYVRQEHVQKPCIRITQPVNHSEPKAVAGHVRKRDKKNVAALPPPTSKSSKPNTRKKDKEDGGKDPWKSNGNNGKDKDDGGDDEKGGGDEPDTTPEDKDGNDDEYESEAEPPWDEENWNHAMEERTQEQTRALIAFQQKAKALEIEKEKFHYQIEFGQLERLEGTGLGFSFGRYAFQASSEYSYNQSMELGSKMPFYKRCADGQKVWRVSANYKLEWPQEVELVHVDVLAKAGWIWREKGYLTPCWTRWTKMEWLKVPPTEGIPELRSIWPEGIAPLPDLPGHTVLCNEIVGFTGGWPIKSILLF